MNMKLGWATWAFQHGKAAGYGTETLSSSKWFSYSIKRLKRRLWVLWRLSSDVKISTDTEAFN